MINKIYCIVENIYYIFPIQYFNQNFAAYCYYLSTYNLYITMDMFHKAVMST